MRNLKIRQRIKVHITRKLYWTINRIKYYKYFGAMGTNVKIGKGVVFEGYPQNIYIGNNVFIGDYSHLQVGKDGRIVLKDGCGIGKFNRLASMDYVELGANTITAFFCTILDSDHNYSFKEMPIKDSGNVIKKTIIGKDSWIGTGVTILKGVNIGEHCVIGANSVVNKDVPSYKMAVGSPAKVVK